MTPSSASVEVRLADSEEIVDLLRAVHELTEALELDLSEPFTMTPRTQERLRAKLKVLYGAIHRLGAKGDPNA